MKTFVIIFILFLSVDYSAASIVEKEPYSIPPERRIKDRLNVLVFPFIGALEPKRKYSEKLIFNYLKNKLQSYKSVRFPGEFILYERMPYNFKSPKMSDENAVSRSLEIYIISGDNTNLDKYKGAGDIEAYNNIDADIIILGELSQDGDDINIKIKIINKIYGRIFSTQKRGNFKSIINLIDNLFIEVIKSIMGDCGYLSVKSMPEDAGVYVDDRYMGKSGRLLPIEIGKHEALIKKEGMLDEKIIFSVGAGETKNLKVVLKEKTSAQGVSLNILTTPDKARVYIDSRFAGISPVKVENLPQGTYRVRADKDGFVTKFKTLDTKDIKAGEITFELEPGSNKDFYFSRTGIYSDISRYSFIGSATGLLSVFYFSLKMQDEKAKQQGFTYADPANPTQEEIDGYNSLKDRTDKKIDRYRLYKSVSIYASVTLLLTAGIFYYLDLRQDDIDIAFYYQPVYINDYRGVTYQGTSAGVVFCFYF